MRRSFVYPSLLALALLAAACSDMPLLEDLKNDVRDNPSDPDGEAYEPHEPSWRVVGGSAVDAAAGSLVSLAIGDGAPYVAFADGPRARVRRFDGTGWSVVGTDDINVGMGLTDLDMAVRGAVPYVVLKPNSYEPTCRYLSGAD